jgi:hypothetical protein
MGGPDGPPAAPVVEPVLTLGEPPLVEPLALVEPPAPVSVIPFKGDVPSTVEVHAVEVSDTRLKAQKILRTVHLQGKAEQARFARRDSSLTGSGERVDLPVRLGTYSSRKSGKTLRRASQKRWRRNSPVSADEIGIRLLCQ